MRRLAAALVAVALAPVGLSDPRPEPLVAPPPTRLAGPLLGILWLQPHPKAKLVRVDPRSLRREGKRAVPVPGWSGAWSFSPDRSRVVVAVHHHADLHSGPPNAWLKFVDVSTLRVVRNVTLGRGGVESIAWLTRSRVLALTNDQLVVVDSAVGRIVERKIIDGELLHVARSAHHMVVLRAPWTSIGPAQLLVADERGNVRDVVLDEIVAGSRPVNDVSAHRHPGLAVDPAGERAYVLSPEGLVADVDLDTSAVTYHMPSHRTSPFARLRDWVEPTAEAKASSGPSRHAQWLGNGLIAVSGVDEIAYRDANGYLHVKDEGAGLRLVDTRSWLVRTLDRYGSGFSLAGRQLLATAWLWDSAAQSHSGIGLTAYAFDGHKRFQLFGGTPVRVELVFRGRAYVGIGEDPTLRIVDLRRGRVVGMRSRPLPYLLLGQASDFWR